MPFTSLVQVGIDIAQASANSTVATPSLASEKGWRELPNGLSNLFREIPVGLADDLKKGECFCDYSGWDFNAEVWWQNDAFQAFVRVYRIHQKTISAPSLEDLMRLVSDEFGYD